MQHFPLLPSKALEALGSRIARARKARGLSQRDLAAQVGISSNTLLALERGAPGSSLGTLAVVLDAMQILGEFDQLLSPERDPALVQFAVTQLDRRGSQ